MRPQQQIDADLARLEAVIYAAGRDLTVDEIATRAALGLPRQSIQRRLRQLAMRNSIVKSGNTRGTRYGKRNVGSDDVPPTAPYEELSYMPLSHRAKVILSRVIAEPASRTPCKYRPAFIEDYKPNRTHYLSKSEKALLHATGSGNSPSTGAPDPRAVQLLGDLIWHSCRLEGTTFTAEAARRLVEESRNDEEQCPRYAQMILNHAAAAEHLSTAEVGIDRQTILKLHARLAHRLAAGQSVGRLRRAGIRIVGSVCTLPGDPVAIEQLFELLLAKASAIDEPFEAALFLLIHLSYLQPLSSLNRCLARVAANIPLMKGNFLPVSFNFVPDRIYVAGLLGVCELNHIEIIKEAFIWSYTSSATRLASASPQLRLQADEGPLCVLRRQGGSADDHDAHDREHGAPDVIGVGERVWGRSRPRDERKFR